MPSPFCVVLHRLRQLCLLVSDKLCQSICYESDSLKPEIDKIILSPTPVSFFARLCQESLVVQQHVSDVSPSFKPEDSAAKFYLEVHHLWPKTSKTIGQTDRWPGWRRTTFLGEYNESTSMAFVGELRWCSTDRWPLEDTESSASSVAIYSDTTNAQAWR